MYVCIDKVIPICKKKKTLDVTNFAPVHHIYEFNFEYSVRANNTCKLKEIFYNLRDILVRKRGRSNKIKMEGNDCPLTQP